jgi:hypothetical protein
MIRCLQLQFSIAFLFLVIHITSCSTVFAMKVFVVQFSNNSIDTIKIKMPASMIQMEGEVILI